MSASAKNNKVQTTNSLQQQQHRQQRQQQQQLELEEAEKEEQRGRSKQCCKKLARALLSHIGLTAMVCAYSVLGGFIFRHLEQTNEKMECEKARERYVPLENDTVHKLWDISASFRQDDDQYYAMEEFKTVLRSYRTIVLDLGYDGKNCTLYGEVDGPGYQWNFAGSLLFSVTVITTVGYGNIAPKTFWGRLVCIAYAVLGIPLMLLCLANIGDVLADVFRFVYTKVCCCGCCRRKDKNKVQSASEKDKGKGTPEAWKSQYTANKMGDGKGPVIIEDDDDDDEEDEEDKISVPLTVTMAIIGIYIFMGALLFGVWEQWENLTAAYYAFVTVTTIGFGDVVPGSANFETAADQWKMVGTAVYMLFGMAIISMCFSLIQEEIVAKFRWVGEKIGIIDKDADEVDDEVKNEKAKQTNEPIKKGPPQTGARPKGAPPANTNYAKSSKSPYGNQGPPKSNPPPPPKSAQPIQRNPQNPSQTPSQSNPPPKGAYYRNPPPPSHQVPEPPK